MAPAWLDSLSEDWVSQPGSDDAAVNPIPTSTTSKPLSEIPKALPASRIPKYNPKKQSQAAVVEHGTSPLSERSLNDYNIPPSHRTQAQRHSKLRDEVPNPVESRNTTPSLSSSVQTTQHHTIQQKSLRKQQSKETPEWRRRLLQGEISYGEQRDLFSPGGLENIFLPPPQNATKVALQFEISEEVSVMPSSPPPYISTRLLSNEAPSTGEVDDHQSQTQKPRIINYILADQSGSEFSANDISQSSSFRPKQTISRRGEVDIGLISASNFNFSPPMLQQRLPSEEANRTASGQSDVRNEKLSPIFLSKSKPESPGDYLSLDLSAAELQDRVDQLAAGDLKTTSEKSYSTSQILIGNTTTETEDYAHNGQFINVVRGGRSREGSFQKRMLSPSSLPPIDESALLPEESIQASTPKQLPILKRVHNSNAEEQQASGQAFLDVPQTPDQALAREDGREQKFSSGNPLKLFGKYDTFTNQKLLRRLSQFEDDLGNGTPARGVRTAASFDSIHPSVDDAFVGTLSPEKEKELQTSECSSTEVHNFGKGELDGFQFSDDVPSSLQSSRFMDEDKENKSVLLSFLGNQLNPSPAIVRNQRSKPGSKHISTSTRSSLSDQIRPASASSVSIAQEGEQATEDPQTPMKAQSDTEGKRTSRSPLKDRTPKRRRTLQDDDISGVPVINSEPANALIETHQQIQTIIGKKRKDAKNGDELQAANPQILAMRQILRPRTPSHTRRDSEDQSHYPPREGDGLTPEAPAVSQGKKIANVQAEVRPSDPLRPPRVELAMSTDTRKGSVTTQDFLDEAKKIMEGIRGRARAPQSGLDSLEESQMEQRQSGDDPERQGDLEDSYQESSIEPFSRPPSREGRPIPRISRTQEDPELLDHLRKYEESSDGEDANALSMRSLLLARDSREAINERQETYVSDSSQNDEVVESDPPNIRISMNPDLGRKRKHSTSSAPTAGEEHGSAEYLTHGSNASSHHSTTRSIPTGSSRGSDSRRVIAPHSVSHLIGDQVGGMVFDSERNMWVKRKAVESGKSLFSSDGSEEDPFENIPDLSVDETQELRRLKVISPITKEAAGITDPRPYGTLQGITLLNGGVVKDHLHSESSKVSRYASNETILETNTRQTSREDESPSSIRHRKIAEHEPPQNITTAENRQHAEEVENEISIYEDRVEPENFGRRRNVTISFSSPVASVIQPSSYEQDEIDGGEEGESADDSLNESDMGNISITRSKNQSMKSNSGQGSIRSAIRRMSIAGHTFSTRPVSRIDEQDEESLVDGVRGGRQRSVSLVLSTPLPPRTSSVIRATPRPTTHEIGTLTLTPLSDFTMHHAEESFGLEVSYLAGTQQYTYGGSKRALSQTIKTLVEKLTEVEPYEPFWEHLKSMELNDKRLTNLHKLDEFCERIEELDVSNNLISHLNGVPGTVRNFRIAHNQLTDLTAWGHLRNLQYIDVSSNDIESLSCFESLVHLRVLRADNNKIKSLDGIGHLDGLLNLRLRGNLIESIDFEGSRLHRLTDLDLKGNLIANVQHIDQLRSLSNLNLEDNKLDNMVFSGTEKLHSLKYLKLSGNNLESIDVSRLSNLRLLYLDRNRLGKVTGLLETRHLDSLSIREQQEDANLDLEFLSEAFEVRKLFLSGNPLGHFEPRVDFLNLQYLEVANCGLEQLPTEFGQMMPNIRVLNLNYNALKDVKPLLGIVRLKKLHLAGNRLARLRKTTGILAQFPSLSLIDLRSNPLTLGFYPPVVERCMVLRAKQEGTDEGTVVEPFTLDTADPREDRRYTNCLDMDTRMLRRVYEMLVFGGCPRLKTLDGLAVDRNIILAKDKVWEALVDARLVSETLPTKEEDSRENCDESDVKQGESDREEDETERWQAEDSFA